MAKTKIGKVSVCPKGTYDANATYQPLDIVTYNGNSFMARTESTGVTPTDGENWQRLTEQKERRFGLIESITLTEDTKTVTRTAEPDGTPYNFTDVYVEMATEPTDASVSSTQTLYFYTSKGIQLGGMYNDGFKTNKYCKVFLIGNSGCGYTIAHKAAALGSFNSHFSTPASRLLGSDTAETPIGKIEINVSTANVVMKAGGTIKIYAIRKE